jgi:nitrite reductase/ring-hydroxylating ferredoxin subunit
VTQEPLHRKEVTRRVMLAGTGLAGLAGVAGCGMVKNDVMAAASQEASQAAAKQAAEASASAAADHASGSTVPALAATSEIPVGGGKIFTAAKVVVTQPVAGQYKAFSAVCTHAQCLVDRVAMGTIDCPCHAAQFSIKDGSVVSGPAPSPLPPRQITVQGSKISLA